MIEKKCRITFKGQSGREQCQCEENQNLRHLSPLESKVLLNSKPTNEPLFVRPFLIGKLLRLHMHMM